MMGYMSGYEIMKLLEDIDREYINVAKNSENIPDKKYATKAHFVVGKIREEFRRKLDKKP